MRVQGEDYVVPGFLSASAADALQAGWMVPWFYFCEKVSLVWLPSGQTAINLSLVGYSPWGHKESDITEQLIQHNWVILTLLVA